jgi:hypothetical protein
LYSIFIDPPTIQSSRFNLQGGAFGTPYPRGKASAERLIKALADYTSFWFLVSGSWFLVPGSWL